MSTDVLGVIPCPLCARESSVKKFAKGRRQGQVYVTCPVHKQFINEGRDFQDWILTNVQMRGADGTVPRMDPVPPPPAESVPEPVATVPPEPSQIPPPEPAVKASPAAPRASLFPLFDHL